MSPAPPLDLTAPALSAAGLAVAGIFHRLRRPGRRAASPSKQSMAAAFASSPGCLAIVSAAEGIYLDVSEGFCHATGYRREDVIGRTAADLRLWVQPEERQRVVDLLESSQVVRDFEAEARTAGGERRTWLLSARRIALDGRPCYVFANQDITERKRAEQALRGSEEKFARAFDGSPDCVAISDLASGTLVEVNEGFERLTGYSRAEIAGRSVADLGLLLDRAPRDRLLAELRAHGRARDIEYQLRRRDGSIAAVRCSADAIDIAGRRCALSVHRDVTALREAEEALRRTEASYRELVENAMDAIFTVDDQGRCLSINRAGVAVIGLSPDALLGRTMLDLIAPEQASHALAQFSRILAGDHVPPFELDIIDGAGVRRTLDLALRPVREAERIIGLQVIARDVTERRQLEQQCRQSQKMEAVGRMAASVAHDFNNLLTVIVGNCEMGDAAGAPPAVRQAVTEIRAAADRAAVLTAQLLAFSRRHALQPRLLNLNDIVGDVQRMLRCLLGGTGDLRFIPAPDLGCASLDAYQFQQVIVNLVVNARDAMPDGGCLTLETRNVAPGDDTLRRHRDVPPAEYVALRVSDTGTGMDEATRARVFEPFFTTKPPGKGTGLGLSTVASIVSQSGGYVSVASEPGAGTTFEIYLPRLDCAGQQRVAGPAADPPARQGAEMVVVVEDDAGVRDLVSTHLELQGYRVLAASTGESALAASREAGSDPDLLIADIGRAGEAGPPLARRLADGSPETPVIYLSGRTDELLQPQDPPAAGAWFLQKPFSLHTLARLVRAVLDGRADRRDGTRSRSGR